MKHFVYFALTWIRGGMPSYPSEPMLKIGQTSNLKKRISSLDNWEHRIKMIHAMEFESKDGAVAIERALIKQFAPSIRYGREWFKMTDQVITFLNGMGIEYEKHL
ncbi:MAG: GIY-YIG nuclease family protein [Chlamydiales bacterium]